MVQLLQPKRYHLQRHNGNYNDVNEPINDERVDDDKDNTNNYIGSGSSNSSDSSARPLPEIRNINEALVF